MPENGEYLLFLEAGLADDRKSGKLWVWFLKAKYGCGSNPIPTVTSHYRMSHMWRGIVKVWHDVEKGILWGIQNGKQTCFWKDNWVPGVGVLEDFCHNNLPPEEESAFVSDYAIDNGWCWDKFSNLLPDWVCDQIASVKPPSIGRDDFSIWQFASDGCFSIKAAYNYLSKSPVNVAPPSFNFSQVWDWQGPQRNKTFLWKVAHGRVLTNAERKSRGMTNDELCPRCLHSPETIMHVLRDCEEVSSLWAKVVHQDKWSQFFSLGLHG